MTNQTNDAAAGPDGVRPGLSPRRQLPRRLLGAGILVAVLAVGAAGGASAIRYVERTHPRSVLLLQPAPIGPAHARRTLPRWKDTSRRKSRRLIGGSAFHSPCTRCAARQPAPSSRYSAIFADPSLVGVSGVTPVRWRAKVSMPLASQSPVVARCAKVSQVSVQSPSV